MAAPIGIFASMLSAHLSSFESIQTVTVGAGGASSISFTSIPQTYKHLQIRFIARTNRANALDWSNYRFNSDSGANYTSHYLLGDGTTASAGNYTSQNTILEPGGLVGGSATAGIFGVGIIDILDYTNANKNKTLRGLLGAEENGSGDLELFSGVWLSNSAITQIDITSGSGSSFVQYSSFALYGSKG